MRTRLLASLLAGVVLASGVGCNIMAPLTYYLRPRQLQKPEFKFPAKSRVVFFVEAARSEMENPVFTRALYERTVAMLRDGKSHADLLPLRAVDDLRREHGDFSKWSLQKIGRTLDVDYVLYLRMDRLQIREAADHPLISPRLEGRLKVIGVEEPTGKERVWPDSREAREITCKRRSSDADDPDAADAQAAKLGSDAAYWVTMPFITVDLEESPPVAH